MNSVDSSEEGGEICEPSLDCVFDVLADTSRRYALSYLQEQSRPVPIADLVAELATWKQSEPLDKISHDAIEQEYLELHHTHLPKLEAADLIHINFDRNTVLLSKSIHPIDQLLEIVPDEE
jgi:DNA-binding transcriptional ArsR family regulator